MCVDLRKLNEVIKHDSYQSPRNDDALVWLASKIIRSTLDIRWGYHNLMLTEEAQKVMTFTTPLGSYSYVRLPFGLATAGALFQRYMNQVLDKWLWNEVIAVVDDVAMGSDTIEEHLELVINVMCVLSQKGFSVKASKMSLFVDEFVFLGHKSTPNGLEATDHLVKAIKDMPTPKTTNEDPKKQLRSFLGMASYARKFVKNFAKITHPLNKLLEDGVEFKWTPPCQEAWDKIVAAIAESKGVYPPDYTLPLYIRTDACCEGLGAYLFQEVKMKEMKGDKEIEVKEERVVEYWSRSVPKPMRSYDARRLELLAVIMALEHFKPYIDGVRVTLDSDHRNLTFIKNVKHSSGQLARWAMRLSEYDFELKYRPGKQMEVADCLSRNALPQELSEEEMEVIMHTYSAEIMQMEYGQKGEGALFRVTWGRVDEASREMGCAMPTVTDEQEDEEENRQRDFDRLMLQATDVLTDAEIIEACIDDKLCQDLLKKLRGDDVDDRISSKWQELKGIVYWHDQGENHRKYVPEKLRHRVMRNTHDSDFNMHAGRESTLQDLKRRYYWPNMDRDVAEFIKHCVWCSKAKSLVPKHAGKLQQTLHLGRGSLVSMDLVKFPQTKEGYDYALTVLDAFSHKLIAIPIKSKEATSVLDAFIQHVVLKGLLPSCIVTNRGEDQKRKGSIVTDNGSEFKNELMQTFLKQFKIRFGYSIPYHPQSNPVERVHRYINALLRVAVSRSDAVHDDWAVCLPYVEFSYNKKFIPGTKVSPFMLHNGYQPLYPEDLANGPIKCQNKTYQEKLEFTTEMFEQMEKIVREANEEAKAKQKVNYDATHFDVEFQMGDSVLHFCDAGLDKLHFKWHGPYEVVEKKSPVKYIIKDALDGQLVEASVQQIIPFYGEEPVYDDDDEMIQSRGEWKSLKHGTFVVFKRHDDVSWDHLHVGEITQAYNSITGAIEILHYVDMGPNDRTWDPAKSMEKRRIFVEYVDPEGNSYTRKRNTTPLI